jgi:type III secretory pathway component EscV
LRHFVFVLDQRWVAVVVVVRFLVLPLLDLVVDALFYRFAPRARVVISVFVYLREPQHFFLVPPIKLLVVEWNLIRVRNQISTGLVLETCIWDISLHCKFLSPFMCHKY